MLSAVVLAAGASTRMGGKQKLLLPFGDEPLVRRAVRQVLAAGFDEVLVVVGSEHEATLAALDGLPIRHAVNTQFATGMGSSFRTAVEHLTSDAAMFALADQPFVTTNEYRTVLDTYLLHRSPIVSVRYGEVMAPPHLFEREFFPELSELQHGARSVLLRHTDRTTVVRFPAELLVDVDTPEDYELAKSRLTSGI